MLKPEGNINLCSNIISLFFLNFKSDNIPSSFITHFQSPRLCHILTLFHHLPLQKKKSDLQSFPSLLTAMCSEFVDRSTLPS